MNGDSGSSEVAELRRAVESIEALADRLAGLLVARPPAHQAPPPRLLSAAEVSEWWGVARRWVYNHADQLGARRLGSGTRPRLRFDSDEVTERLGVPGRAPGPADGRRLTAIDRNPHCDSLSARGRAIVAEREKQAAGRRANAPGPAPKNRASTR